MSSLDWRLHWDITVYSGEEGPKVSLLLFSKETEKQTSKQRTPHFHKMISGEEGLDNRDQYFLLIEVQLIYNIVNIYTLPQWLSNKESACNAGAAEDAGSIPGSGRSPGGGQGNPLQYSCLQNPKDRGAWQATVHGITKSQTLLKWLSTYIYISSVQFSSVAQWCPTHCDPIDCSTPGFPVHHQLLELTQTHAHQVGDANQRSYPLASPFPPTFNLSQHQSLFRWVSSSHQVAKVLEFQLQHQSFQWIFRIDSL